MLVHFHFSVFVSATGHAWESMLEDETEHGTEPSGPVVLAETVPGQSTLIPQQTRANCQKRGSQLRSEEISSQVQPKLLTHGLKS